MTETQPECIQVVPKASGPNGASQFALGFALAGAAIGRSAYMQAPDGRVYHSALNIVIGTDNPTRVLASLHPVLSPLKFAQAQRHKTLAEMDSSVHEKALTEIREDRLAFIQSDPMAAAEDLAYFDQQMMELQNLSRPMMFLECPLPGRVTLALGKSAGTNLLVVYDDLSFQGLLNAARMTRGNMDLEAMAKSNRQEIFDGAYLEGVHNTAVISPMITTIMVGTVEQVTRLLLTKDPVVAAFADTCLVMCDSDDMPACPGLTLPPMDLSTWQRAVTRLLAARAGETRIVRMGKDAAQVLAGIERQVVEGYRSVPAEHGRFVHHLSRQAVRTALILHMVGGAPGDEITCDELQQPVDFIQLSARHRMALLERELQREAVAFREKVVRIVSAEPNPLSARDICGHIHGLKPSVLRPTLAELVEAGRLEEQNGKYIIPGAMAMEIAAG